MDQKEYITLLDLIDQGIANSEPRRAEYFRGYLRGLQFHVLGKLEETEHNHCLFVSPDGISNDPYLDAYARGYRDGAKGLTPENTP